MELKFQNCLILVRPSVSMSCVLGWKMYYCIATNTSENILETSRNRVCKIYTFGGDQMDSRNDIRGEYKKVFPFDDKAYGFSGICLQKRFVFSNKEDLIGNPRLIYCFPSPVYVLNLTLGKSHFIRKIRKKSKLTPLNILFTT